MATKFPTVEVSVLAQRGLVPDATPPRPLVLVVDDEPMIAETLAAIFESAGFQRRLLMMQRVRSKSPT